MIACLAPVMPVSVIRFEDLTTQSTGRALANSCFPDEGVSFYKLTLMNLANYTYTAQHSS